MCLDSKIPVFTDMSNQQLRQFALFLLKSAVAGLAIAFVLLYFFPGLFETGRGNNLETGDAASPPGNQNETISYKNAVALSAPSVVNIYASKVLTRRIHPLLQDPIFRRFFGAQNQEQQRNINIGSGVILSSDGYLVTNAHLINEADEILVTLVDGRRIEAELIGMDTETDLALLQVKLESLPSILIGDSDELDVGDVVLAIGNPYDFGQTVTQGIVSAKGRKRLGISMIEGFIQTDADINPGNSGGALINTRGQLVGINTVIITSSRGSQGIGLAIPIKIVFDVMQQLLDHGHVIRGYLGVMAEVLPHDTLDNSGQKQSGILVAGIVSGGPAAEAGIIPGDIITEINNTPLYDPQQAIQMISGIKPGTEIEVIVIRGWEEMILKATVTQKPPMDFQ